MNITKYTGRAYNFRTYNCWHHVSAVRADVGLSTPVFDVCSAASANAVFDQGRADGCGFEQHERPNDYDIVLMGVRTGGRLVWHSGVYFGGYVSHCARSARQVKLELLSDLRTQYSEIEFWRQ